MKTLRIGIDGYNLAMPKGTGIATYGVMLGRTLAAAGHDLTGIFGIDTGHLPALAETLFFDQFARDEPPPLPRGEGRRRRRRADRDALLPFRGLNAVDVPLTDAVVKDGFVDRLPPFNRIASYPRLFDVAHRRFNRYGSFVTLRMPNPPEVMHWTYPLPIEVAGARNIYTIHDIVPLKLPYATLDVKTHYRALTAACVRRGAAICTVSEASHRDIVDQLGANPMQVVNTYQISSVPASILASDPADDAARIERIFGLAPQGYFLYFGAIEPKKNVGRLIEAFLSLDTDIPLVVVGGRAWQAAGELALLPVDRNDDVAAGRIRKLDYLPRDLLLRLVRGARGVAFPSLYEGFGLPVLEALQLGVPVITSRAGSLGEVAGDAAIYVDPYDVDSIIAGLAQLDRDADVRRSLAIAGPSQAARFSAASYIGRLSELYQVAQRP